MSKRRSFGTVRKLPSNKWQASFVGPDKQRHYAPRTFIYSSQAKDWLKGQESLLVLGKWENPALRETINLVQKHLFAEYAQRHIEVQTSRAGSGLRPSTRELYEQLLRNHLRRFHELSLEKISSAMVDDWWAAELSTGKKTTAAKAYTLLSAVMSRAEREDFVSKNPCKVYGARGAKTGLKIEIPNADEVERLTRVEDLNFGLMVSVMAFAGLRYGECASLTFIDFERRLDETGRLVYLVNIDKSATVVKRQVLVGPPKTKMSTRKVFLNSRVSERVERHFSSNTFSPDDLVFPSPTGGIWRNDSFNRVWRRMLKKEGIVGKRITPHSLRHYGATTFNQAGGGIADLKAFLGDSSTSAVTGYLHAGDNQLNIVQRMAG